MRPPSIMALAALLLSLQTLPCFGDTITLKDGRKLIGKVEREEGGRIHLILRYGKMIISRADVASIEEGPTPEEIYRDRASEVSDDDLDGILDLARWCEEADLDRESRWEYGRILEIDTDHPKARAALGFVMHEEKWITKAEHREITRYPWVRPMRERLEKTKVTLDFTRAELFTVLREMASQTADTFRIQKAPKLKKTKLTYKCEDRPVSAVLDDLAQNIEGFDFVLTEVGVVITIPREARKIRRKIGMPSKTRQRTTEQIQKALQVRHLTLLFLEKPLPWVIRYLETLSGVGMVLDAPAPVEPFSYSCTAKPLGDILNDILAPRGLAYRIVGASVLITAAR